MNMNSQLKYNYKNNFRKDTVSCAIWMLFIGLVFCFSDNHNALAIADYCAFLIFFVVFMLIKRRYVITLHPLMLSLVMLLIGSVIFYSIVDRGTLLSYLIWIPAVILGVTYRFNKKELSVLMWGFILGSAIMSMLVIIQQHHYGVQGSFRFSFQLWDNEEVDPNFLASFLYIGAIFAFSTILNDRRQTRKLLAIVPLLIILYAIIMTGSRAAILGLAIAFCGIVLRFFKSAKSAIVAVAVGLVCLLPLLLVLPNIFTVDLSRFDLRTLMDDSNMKRLKHWYAAVICILDRPLLGYGAAHGMTILTTYAGYKGGAHNTLLTLLLHFGLIGSIPILAMIWKIFCKFRTTRNVEWMFYYFGFLFINLIISNHLGISLWLPFMIFYQISNRT